MYNFDDMSEDDILDNQGTDYQRKKPANTGVAAGGPEEMLAQLLQNYRTNSPVDYLAAMQNYPKTQRMPAKDINQLIGDEMGMPSTGKSQRGLAEVVTAARAKQDAQQQGAMDTQNQDRLGALKFASGLAEQGLKGGIEMEKNDALNQYRLAQLGLAQQRIDNRGAGGVGLKGLAETKQQHLSKELDRQFGQADSRGKPIKGVKPVRDNIRAEILDEAAELWQSPEGAHLTPAGVIAKSLEKRGGLMGLQDEEDAGANWLSKQLGWNKTGYRTFANAPLAKDPLAAMQGGGGGAQGLPSNIQIDEFSKWLPAPKR